MTSLQGAEGGGCQRPAALADWDCAQLSETVKQVSVSRDCQRLAACIAANGLRGADAAPLVRNGSRSLIAYFQTQHARSVRQLTARRVVDKLSKWLCNTNSSNEEDNSRTTHDAHGSGSRLSRDDDSVVVGGGGGADRERATAAATSTAETPAPKTCSHPGLVGGEGEGECECEGDDGGAGGEGDCEGDASVYYADGEAGGEGKGKREVEGKVEGAGGEGDGSVYDADGEGGVGDRRRSYRGNTWVSEDADDDDADGRNVRTAVQTEACANTATETHLELGLRRKASIFRAEVMVAFAAVGVAILVAMWWKSGWLASM